MKLLNYKLQNQIEALGENKPTNYFKDYLKAVLEDTNTKHYQKCDYLGLSLSEIKNKIDALSKDIAELSELKRNLSTALGMAKELTAEIFIENGIDRIDGNIISSLTLSKESTKAKDEIRILDENALMDLGYVKFSIDMDALKADINAGKANELKDLVEVSTTYSILPAKIKVNKKRNSNQNVVVCYKAIVKVDVYDIDHSTMISRQDVGFGTGVARSLADAHENSAKEAVTDALKRSLRSFGNQFGNSLYDKSKSVAQNNNAPSNIPSQNLVANQNANSRELNQMPNQVPNDQVMGDIQSLRNMGLDVVEQNGFLLVCGNNIFTKKDLIKSLGFRWDSKTKQWYKQLASAA